ncbi:hypothetical protein Cni_G25567 [Canna indica]|uniref:DUF668 domain-containing protein n=1 Tax=Canna indica TaxID=4628 RepID=A0AAQ3KXY4_9LILI|nr:hypothetical protein Cni_G25567 [Canna indica]
MALESWLSRLKSAISTGIDAVRAKNKKPNVGILAFEIATLMKLVYDDDSFLLSLACAELVHSLRLVAQSAALLSQRCSDPALRKFGRSFEEFSDSGRDVTRWLMGWNEMESKAARKMDWFVASTAALHKEMDGLSEAEHGLRKIVHCGGGGGEWKRSMSAGRMAMVAEIQQKVFWQKQQVKYLKQTSLWSCSFDAAVLLLVRSAFTLSTLGPLVPSSKQEHGGFLGTSSTTLTPPPGTLGTAALALHYANLIVVLEKMIRSPRAVGADARDDLYGMLPASVRGRLQARLRGVGWGAARDAGLAAEWKTAVARIAGWLGPVAHDTIRWQGERSFERRSATAPRANVLLLQTLYFANTEKVEAAVTELLVGLNYMWRFEIEMSALAIVAVDGGLQQQEEKKEDEKVK